MSLGGSRAAVALAEVTPNCVVENHHEEDDDDDGDGEDDEDVQDVITHQFMFPPSPLPQLA